MATINAHGFRQAMDSLVSFPVKIRAAQVRAVRQYVTEIDREAKELMRDSPPDPTRPRRKFGSQNRIHFASFPGRPPRVETGRMRRTFKAWIQPFENEVWGFNFFGSPARFLQEGATVFGKWRMDPRPFVDVAKERVDARKSLAARIVEVL